MEKMSAFFAARVEGYDDHMLTNVEGCKEAYLAMAQLIPDSCQSLLDLGCGTGLELDAIFQRLPNVSVVGIDLTSAMLEKLRAKHPDKDIHLICGSYFSEPLGIAAYDCAVSFQTMHHFSHEMKAALYAKVFRALKPGGMYIECDYMVEDQALEDFYYAENRRIRSELGLSESEFYHYDTPCTIDHQISMLQSAGFAHVQRAFRLENTTILAAQ